MNHQLLQYIKFAREHKMSDPDIRGNLTSAGWDGEQVDAALKAGDDTLLLPPPPPAPAGSAVVHSSGGNLSPTAAGTPAAPIAVVQQRTTRGLEYTIMFVALGATAISLGELLHSVVDNSFGGDNSSGDLVSFASSALIVALPIFAWLFLRLKKAEIATPEIRTDSSRRHAVQLALIVSFVWGLFRLVTYVYSLLNGGAGTDFLGSDNSNPVANILHTLITLSIAGGIFAYYWHDEHKKGQQ